MRIIYNLDGKLHRYTPDLLVERRHKKQLIEVKPKDKVFTGDNRQRFNIIKRVCQGNGFEFIVVTDEKIRIQPRLNSVKLFWKYARTPIYPQHQLFCRELFSIKEEIRMRDIWQFFTLKGISTSVVYSMMYHGILAVDWMQPIDSDSLIQFTGATAAIMEVA